MRSRMRRIRDDCLTCLAVDSYHLQSLLKSSVAEKKMSFAKRALRAVALLATLVSVSGFTECYKPVTKNQLPNRIRTIAVPAFQNQALRYKIEHHFTEAVINEIVRRGR